MKKAILITYDRDDAVGEAKALCTAAGYDIAHIFRQDFLRRQRYGISEEMMDRLEDTASSLKPDVIIYDEILKPSQNYNLASRLHRNILDREAVILEIFEERASSAESKLQIKLAQMRYEMSRAKEKVRLAKMGEQPGFMGIGKFEVDVYYNDIRHRMQTVRSKLKKVGRQRELHRQSRKRSGFKTVSLAGYTSAGKTTLFNALTGELNEEKDELFTTLSTTTRRCNMGQSPVLVSDTVGFISKLPAYMIEAFRATLEELLYADAVVVVVDISDRPADLVKKFKSCYVTLDQLGVMENRIIFVLNKADLEDRKDLEEKIDILGLADNKKWVIVSARTGEGLDAFKRLALRVMNAGPGDGAQ